MNDQGAGVKACCAAAYGEDVVALLLGESYHPGGVALTRRLADALGLEKGARVLDVAAGVGTTALLLAEERGAEVVGIDLGPSQVEQARTRARVRSLSLGASSEGNGIDAESGRPGAHFLHQLTGGAGSVRFEVGDAERLAVGSGSFDAVVCECAFCTFPDKETAAAELARVLRPGGQVGITDIWLDPSRLEVELSGLAGRVACLADARPIAELTALLEGAGLRVDLVERHDEALAAMIRQVETRLRALRLVDLPALRGFDLRRGVELARQAAAVVARGDAGYVLVVASKQ